MFDLLWGSVLAGFVGLDTRVYAGCGWSSCRDWGGGEAFRAPCAQRLGFDGDVSVTFCDCRSLEAGTPTFGTPPERP